MHAEYYSLPEQTAALINDVRANGGRIIAVGTTSARTLETAARICGLDKLKQDGAAIQIGVKACQGWTDIFLYPGEPLLLVDALLTNFHLPK
jgi:S-adenosylmethionine:tRNA ribosyltransferase-isomerase